MNQIFKINNINKKGKPYIEFITEEKLLQRAIFKELKFSDIWSKHFWMGLECEYPICCIFWFCNCVTNFGEQRKSLFERMFREIYCREYYTRKQSDFEDRNMCPDCILKKLKDIKR